MGKKLMIICDKCGNDMIGEKHYTMKVREMNGNRTFYPVIYICQECLQNTGLDLVLKNEVSDDWET